jgi:hypothetical protein
VRTITQKNGLVIKRNSRWLTTTILGSRLHYYVYTCICHL